MFIMINIRVFTNPAYIVELGGLADRQTPSSEMRETPGISTVFFPVKIFQRGSSPLGNHYKQKPLICSSPMNTFWYLARQCMACNVQNLFASQLLIATLFIVSGSPLIINDDNDNVTAQACGVTDAQERHGDSLHRVFLWWGRLR